MDIDDAFYSRADEHINLSNRQMFGWESRGKVDASMMYASARFSAWLAWTWSDSQEDMENRKTENIEYFMEGFKECLLENFDGYLENYQNYKILCVAC